MHKNKLSDYFPMIRTREEVIKRIDASQELSAIFYSWRKDQQDAFLDICSGVRGCKLLYDSYFKEVLNPEVAPERLSRMLSLILKRKVIVKGVLSNDSSRLGDEMSLVITDIVVELEDGTIANVEVQKIGYAFTGERASCYSADLLLRQYKRVRDERKEQFSYKDICPVYTIVFMENSPADFKNYMDENMHTFSAKSDTGMKLNMLQNIIFIPIDIFLQKLHNKNSIDGDFEAWLTFLGCDEPEYIIKLIKEYPYFLSLYNDLYNMCLNVERVLGMFSEELRILDRNTVKYMIDEMQEELDTKKAELESTKEELDSAKTELDTAKTELEVAKSKISDQSELIARLQAENDALKRM